MSNTTTDALASYVERARKVLQHEQRTHHQDQAIKPGGLELFVARWADEASAACKNAGLDISPVHRFTEHLEGYRQQDPMQRAASLRAALAILNELDNDGRGPNQNTAVSAPQPTAGRDKSGPYAGAAQAEPSVSPATTHTAKADKAPLRSSQSTTVSSEAARLPKADGKALPSAPQNTIPF